MALKRTGIKRGTKPMERRTELHRGDSQLARTPLRSTSKKRERENRERTAMKKESFPAGTRCAKPGCWKPYQDVHEPLTRARGGSITDPNNAAPSVEAFVRAVQDDYRRYGSPNDLDGGA